MATNRVVKGCLVISSVLSLAIAIPAQAASTKDEIKALKEEVEVLQKGQEDIQKDLAEITKLLKDGAKAAPARAAKAPFEPKDLVVGDSAFMGSDDATVTIFSYSDYQCPYCRRHATTVMPQIIKEYVDSGKVRMVMREYPIQTIHPRAFAAAQAAACAGQQGKYFEMHDMIFANQKALSDDDLKAHSQSLQLDTAAWDACFANEETIKQINAEIAEAQGMGVTGTPSFVVGLTDPDDSNAVRVTKYIRGAQAFPAFQSAFDELLKTAKLAKK